MQQIPAETTAFSTARSTSRVTSTSWVLRSVFTRSTSMFPPVSMRGFYHRPSIPPSRPPGSPLVQLQFTPCALSLAGQREKMAPSLNIPVVAAQRPATESPKTNQSGGSRGSEHRNANKFRGQPPRLALDLSRRPGFISTLFRSRACRRVRPLRDPVRGHRLHARGVLHAS